MTKKLLNESWLKMFGEWNKELLRYMYGKDVKMHAELGAHKAMGGMIKEEGEEDIDNTLKFSISGEERDVQTYANAIMAQKNYIDCYVMHGRDHMQTIKLREVLRQAVRTFEQTTDITWPFSTEA
jgi:hypothetical protein